MCDGLKLSQGRHLLTIIAAQRAATITSTLPPSGHDSTYWTHGQDTDS